MSYFNEKLDAIFKVGFSSSYGNFSDSEIEKRASDILLSSVREPTSGDRFLVKRLVNEGFRASGREQYYETVYQQYLKSLKLFTLFEASVNFDYLRSPEIKRAAFSISEGKFFKSEAVRYARYEKIPTEFALVALNDDCLKYLVGVFLKRHLFATFTPQILMECKELTKKWQLNLELATPYERTGEFQSYLHRLANSWPGDRGELKISAKLMRIILSAARLHFSYTDEKNLSVSALSKVVAAQIKAAELEATSSEDDFFRNACLSSTTTKKYIKNWRKRHLSPFFRKTDAVEKMQFLSSLNSEDKYSKMKSILVSSDLFSIDELQAHFSGLS